MWVPWSLLLKDYYKLGFHGWIQGPECSPLRHGMAQLAKNLPAMQETPVRLLCWDDPLEKGKATHSSIMENSMDSVHGVTRSQTRLSDFHLLLVTTIANPV